MGTSEEETLRRIQATPEVAHLTMEDFGVTDQSAGGDEGLCFSTKIHMTQSKRH